MRYTLKRNKSNLFIIKNNVIEKFEGKNFDYCYVVAHNNKNYCLEIDNVEFVKISPKFFGRAVSFLHAFEMFEEQTFKTCKRYPSYSKFDGGDFLNTFKYFLKRFYNDDFLRLEAAAAETAKQFI